MALNSDNGEGQNGTKKRRRKCPMPRAGEGEPSTDTLSVVIVKPEKEA